MKTHLKRTLSTHTYTWEEMETILCQVEAILNCRPLCPLTNDVKDLDVLTPNHSLSGSWYIPIAQPDRRTERLATLNRWEAITHQYQNIVWRYKNEYLSRMQQRPIWQQQRKTINTGDLVLIKEDNMVATEWPLGRVIETIKGADGLVRVVKLKTRQGEKTRPITKISPLPLVEAPPELNTPDPVKAPATPKRISTRLKFPLFNDNVGPSLFLLGCCIRTRAQVPVTPERAFCAPRNGPVY